MTQPIRMLVSLFIAIGVTVSLFLFMSYLITNKAALKGGGESLAGIKFGEVKIDETLQIRERRIPPKPPPPKDQPPPPKMNIQNQVQQETPLPDLDMPAVDVPIGGSGPFLGAFGNTSGTQNLAQEGDIIPLVRIEPQYPRRAALGKIEGWVEVEFTITETGTVADPSVKRSQPPRIFDREAMRAILRWKFKPRIVEGKAIPRRATQIIDFKLAAD